MEENTKLFLLGILIAIAGIIAISVGVYGLPQYSTTTTVIGLITLAGGGFLAYKKGKNL